MPRAVALLSVGVTLQHFCCSKSTIDTPPPLFVFRMAMFCEDELALGSDLNDDADFETPPSKKGQKRGRAGDTPGTPQEKNGGASKSRKTQNGQSPQAAALKCIVDNTEPRYGRFRFCQQHKSCYDAMKWQADNPGKGEPVQTEGFLEAMADDATAVAAIKDWETLNPPSKKFARKKPINWAGFGRKYGVRVARKQIEGEVPMEEGEFIIWKTQKKGWDKPQAEDAWKRALRANEIADYRGQSGKVRLWIQKKELRTREREVYGDNFQEEGSDRVKNPAATDIDALRVFAHTSATDFSHEFFDGKSTLAMKEKDKLPKRVAAAAPGSDDEDPPNEGVEVPMEDDDADLGSLRSEKYAELSKSLSTEVSKLTKAHRAACEVVDLLMGRAPGESAPPPPRNQTEAKLRNSYLTNVLSRIRIVSVISDVDFDAAGLRSCVCEYKPAASVTGTMPSPPEPCFMHTKNI